MKSIVKSLLTLAALTYVFVSCTHKDDSAETTPQAAESKGQAVPNAVTPSPEDPAVPPPATIPQPPVQPQK